MAKKNEAKVIFRAVTDQFEQGIKQAKTSITGLNAQLRLNSQEMAKSGTSTQLLAQRVDLLTSKQREQQAVVNGLENKLEAARFVYGENSTEVQKLNNQLTSARATLQSFPNQTDQARQKLLQSKTAYGQTNQAIKEQQAELKQLKQDYANAVVEQGKGSAAAKDLEAKIRKLSNELGQNAEKLQLADKAADDLGNSYKTAAEKSEALKSAAEKVGNGMQNVGMAMTATATPAIVAAGAASFKMASDFESSMSRVEGALDDPSANMAELSDLALQMGADTIFGASQAGDAMEELAKGGLTAADIKGGALATTMDLAAAGSLQLADSANTVVQAMGAFELSADQTGQAANALAGAAAASSADVSDLTQGLSQASAQAHSAGWSIQDTTAVLGAFADAGIVGSDAGTSLKTMLQRLAAPTDKAAETIDALGINVRDSNGSMLDAAGVAQELTDKLGGLSSAEKDAAMQTIFGSDASRAALVMTNKGREGIEKYTAATNDQTAAQRLAESQMGESERAIEEMNGAIETAGIQIGQALAPVVRDVAETVGVAAEEFSELSDEEKCNVIATAAVVAGMGPALLVLSKMITIAGAVGSGIKTASKHVKDFGGDVKAMGVKAKAASIGVKAAKAAVGGLAAVLAGLIIGEILEDLAEWKERSDAVSGATDGMRDAIAMMNADLSGAVPSIEAASEKTADLSASALEAMQSQADLAKGMKESWQDINTDKALIDEHMGVIEALTGKYDENGNKVALTKEEQAKLQAAVAGVNEVCGTSYSIIDAQNGILSASTGEIKGNTEAWIANANAQAAQEQMVDMKKQWYDLDRQRNDLNKEIAEDEARLNKLNERRTDLTREEASEQQSLVNKLEDSRAVRDGLNDSLRENEEAQKYLNAKLVESQDALTRTTEAIRSAIAGNEEWSAALADSGVDVDAFSQKLSELGYSTSDLASMSTEQLMALAGAYGSSTADIIAMCDQMGIAVPQKMREAVTGATQAVTAETPNAASAMLLFKDGMLQSYDPVSGQFSQVTNDALAQITGGIAAGAPSVDMAVMTMRDGMFYTYDPLTKMFVQATDSAMIGAAAAVSNGTPPVQSATAGLVEGVDYETGQMPGKVADNTAEAGNALVAGIDAAQGPVASSADAVSKLAADHMSSASADAWWAGHNMAADSFRSGIDGGRGSAAGAADVTSKHVADHFSSANGDAWWAGYNMSAGLAQGIYGGRSLAVNAAANVARDAINAAKREADINSPSGETEELGEFFTEGLAVGTASKAGMAVEAASDMVGSAVDAARSAVIAGVGKSPAIVDPIWAVPNAIPRPGSVAGTASGHVSNMSNVVNSNSTKIEMNVNIEAKGADAGEVAAQVLGLMDEAQTMYGR